MSPRSPAQLRSLLEQEAEALGVPVSALGALPLYPLVHVAWADGTVQPEEANAVLSAADDEGFDIGARTHLVRWLTARPSKEEHERLTAMVRRLYQAMPLPVRREANERLLGLAHTVAEVAGEEGPHRVTPGERAAIGSVARCLGIGDHSWSSILHAPQVDRGGRLEQTMGRPDRRYRFLTPEDADRLLVDPGPAPDMVWGHLERVFPWAERNLLGPEGSTSDQPRKVVAYLEERRKAMPLAQQESLGLRQQTLVEQHPWPVVKLICRVIAGGARQRLAEMQSLAELPDDPTVTHIAEEAAEPVDELATSLLWGGDLEILSRDYARMVSAFFRSWRLLARTEAADHVYAVPVVGRPDFEVPAGHTWNWMVDTRRRLIVPFDLASADFHYDSGRRAEHFNDLFDASALNNRSAFLAELVNGWYAPQPLGAVLGELTGEDSEDRALLVYRMAFHGRLPRKARRRIGELLGADPVIQRHLDAAELFRTPMPVQVKGETPESMAVGLLDEVALLRPGPIDPDVSELAVLHHGRAASVWRAAGEQGRAERSLAAARRWDPDFEPTRA